MRLVIIESPYAGFVARNVAYARAAMVDCLKRGEAPFASHILYPHPDVLRDGVPEDRQLGIRAGLAWAEHADATVVYEDLGVTEGMLAGIEHAAKFGRPVEHRSLPGWSALRGVE